MAESLNERISKALLAKLMAIKAIQKASGKPVSPWRKPEAQHVLPIEPFNESSEEQSPVSHQISIILKAEEDQGKATGRVTADVRIGVSMPKR